MASTLPLALALTGALAAGCAASIAPIGRYEAISQSFSAGAGATSLVYLSRGRGVVSRGEGPVVGFEAEALARVSGAAPNASTFAPRGALLAGWSTAPMPYRASRLGYEVFGSVGLGAVPVDGHLETAGAFGARVGMPIRLTSGAPPWRRDHPFGLELFAVPHAATAFHVPASGADPGLDFSLGAAFRLHFWSALLP